MAAGSSDSSSVRVERLGTSDVPRYRELMLHAYATTHDVFTSTVDERAAEPESWWLRRVADTEGRSLALGAFRNGELVGTVTIEFAAKSRTRHKAKLVGMFVREEFRSLGAGAGLIEAALAEVRARGEVRIVTLTVTEGNVPAMHLYERFGFRQFGVEPMAIAVPGGYKSKVHMHWMAGDHDAS